MSFKAFHSAKGTIDGVETTVHMSIKGQLAEKITALYEQFMAWFCPQIGSALGL